MPRSAHILIVEDNPTNLELMTYLLEAFLNKVSCAIDGAEGLEAVRRVLPDLVICDVNLPTVSGYDVAHRMKRDPAIKNIPLVAVTALAMVGDRDKVLAAGFDGYISKPISPETFVQQVQSFLPPDRRSEIPRATYGIVAETPKPACALCNATVLIIDNEAVNHTLKRTILEPFGYRVLTSNSVSDAYDLCKANHPDVVITDIHLADGTGYDVLRYIKSDPGLRNTAVFVLSASATAEDKQLAWAGGAQRVLERPIEPEILLSEIADVIHLAKGYSNGDRPDC